MRVYQIEFFWEIWSYKKIKVLLYSLRVCEQVLYLVGGQARENLRKSWVLEVERVREHLYSQKLILCSNRYLFSTVVWMVMWWISWCVMVCGSSV